MNQIGTISIKNNAGEFKRIGPNKRSVASETAIGIEEVFRKLAPLPTTYDVSPMHQPYFSEFTYFDAFGGIMGATMNEEVNARVVKAAMQSVQHPDTSNITKLVAGLHDKYVLKPVEKTYSKIVFYPGSNLLHAVDHAVVDRFLFENPDAVIKPHPVMTDDGLRHIAARYGYYRMVDPKESGVGLLGHAETILYTANSEIGMLAAALKIPAHDCTAMQHFQKMTYAPIYVQFKNNSVVHNHSVLSALFIAKASGLLMPWMADIEERASAYFTEAMKVREFFKPSYPWNGPSSFNPIKPKE